MGFFMISPLPQNTISGTRKAVNPKYAIPIRALGEKAGGCARCTLDAEAKNLYHAKMKPSGSPDPLIYILNEFPSEQDDREGEQFVGRAGDFVREYIPEKFDRYIRWNNQVRCGTPKGRTPTREELIACSQFQVKDIEESKPLLIIGFGLVPLLWATEQTGIQDWRGSVVPVRIGNHSCWYAAMWHPRQVIHMKNDKKMAGAVLDTYKRDFKRLFDLIEEGMLIEPFVPSGEALSEGLTCEMSWDVKQVERVLASLNDSEQCIDIETNGIRPFTKDSKILSVAIGTWDKAYSIPIKHREAKWTDVQLKKIWKLIEAHLTQKDKTFTAHHLKFEQEWLSMPWALGRDILFEVNWGDTMAQAEVLRTQSLTAKSLNARCVAIIGVPNKTLDDLNIKNLDNEPLHKVLLYNARDVKFTDLLRQRQNGLIEKEGLEQAYSLMVSRVPALTIAQQSGVVPNTKFAEAKHRENLEHMQELEKKIQELPDVKKMTTETGKAFNTNSPTQLATLMRDRLKLKEGWRVVDGVRKYSTDEEVLSRVTHPIAKLILEKRSFEKMDGTYILGMCSKNSFSDPECGKLIHYDGLVHTNYNYLKTSTGRTSCVHEDTPIVTRRGLVRAADVVVGDFVFTHKNRWRSVTRLWRKGINAMFDVKFSNGFVLRCTDAHEILTNCGEWVAIGDINVSGKKGMAFATKEREEGSRFVPKYRKTTYDCSSSRGIENSRQVCQSGLEIDEPKRVPSPENLEVFSEQNRYKKSGSGEIFGQTSQLEGGLRRWGRLSNHKIKREEAFRAPSDSGRNASTYERAACLLRSASHRRGSWQQSSGQPCDSNLCRTCADSFFADGDGVIYAERKDYCGDFQVYDFTVEEDHSYLSCGVFNHNSEGPNLQNYPMHENREIRNVIMAPPGFKLAALDYGQIEARVIAMDSRCPVLCKALWEHYDVHMDWAKKISNRFEYVLDKYAKAANNDETKILKAFRQDVKNKWTFPLFFGSRIDPVAEVLDIPVAKLRPLFDEFWDMFKEVKRMQDRMLDTYKKKGYTETLTGRRRYEPLSLNEIINSPIQGCASDIVLHAMERLCVAAYEMQQWQLAPRLNVHDDLSLYLPDETLNEDLEIILPLTLTPKFDFINVPLTVDIKIGTLWGEMEEVFSVESTDYNYPKRAS